VTITIPKKFRIIWDHVVYGKSSLTEISNGFAIGAFVAFLPALGFQTVLTLLLAALFKTNKWMALLANWICNPFTIPPIFLVNYGIGRLVYREGIEFAEFQSLIHDWDFHKFADLGADLLIPLWIGSLITAPIMSYVARRLCFRYYSRVRKKVSWPRTKKAPRL
jgi:uncharacterized protein (DUF2062 family)